MNPKGDCFFEKEEESTLKDTKHELLVVIANQGYTELIMDAARGAKAHRYTSVGPRTHLRTAKKGCSIYVRNPPYWT